MSSASSRQRCARLAINRCSKLSVVKLSHPIPTTVQTRYDRFTRQPSNQGSPLGGNVDGVPTRYPLSTVASNER